LIISGGIVLAPDVGAGCKNVDVAALPIFRGVKCCCKVEKAGLAVFVGSSFDISRRSGCGTSGLSVLGTELAARPPFVVSDFALMLLVRLNPASLADVLGAVGAGSVEPTFDFKLLGAMRDLGLVVEIPVLPTSLRRLEVLLVDWVRL
jgi:hypothetical protein